MNELVFATLQDLSGAARGMARQAVAGMRLVVEEANARGGVRGQPVRLLVRDHAFDAATAGRLAADLCAGAPGKLRPLAFVGSMGSSPNLAAQPVLQEWGVANLFPLAAAAPLYEPVHPLRFASTPSYLLQMSAATRHVVQAFGARRVGVLVQDDAFGREVREGVLQALRDEGLEPCVDITLAGSDQATGGHACRIREAACEWMMLGTLLPFTAALLRAACDEDCTTQFLGSISTHSELMVPMAGAAAAGFWSASTANLPEGAQGADWSARYEATAGHRPGVYSVHGFLAMRHVVQALEAVNGAISTTALCATLERLRFAGEPFGADELSFTADRHLGSARVRLSRIADGHWRTATDFLRNTG